MTRTALLTLLIATLGGCAGSVSMQGWQDEFESYVANYESGDVSFLRDPGGESRHKRFAVLGDLSPDKSTEVCGAFLGRSTVQGRPWLVFVVAQVKQRDVEDIRVAMASDDHPTRQWIWSQENDAALNTYKRYRESRWRNLDPTREQSPIEPGLFPPDEDIFRFEFAGNTAWVSERNSGARWTIVLPNRN